MLPKLIAIDGFFLPTYGVLVAAAFLVALWLTSRLAKKSGLNPEQVTNLGIYAALAGLAGAKLMMFVVHFDYYRQNPGEIFSLSTLQAGGVYYGGLMAALATGLVYLRVRRLPALRTLDAFAPGIALGYAIGRLGCFSAGCCWGLQCDRAWAVTFTNPEAHQLVGVPLNVPLHPTQLYLAALSLGIFAAAYWWFHRPHREGTVIGLYLALYSLARFAVDFFRYYEQPNPFGGPLTATQWLALALLLLGLWLVFRRAAGEAAPAGVRAR
jgi:phosphatidylglycerol:prolipoprotein diacylglycerol transferase